MNAALTIQIVSAVLANVPAAISTGKQVLALVQDAYNQAAAVFEEGRDYTPQEIDASVAKIVANSAVIQSLD